VLPSVVDGSGRILILGGTGHFGARICRRLANDSRIELVISSRSLNRAQELVVDIARSGNTSQIFATELDQNTASLTERLGEFAPNVVIHTAGPYQGQQYTVARACIAAGCHYIDLADGREFVAGIDSLDAAARGAGVALISGASTLPAVPAAIIDECRNTMHRIRSIRSCIAPAQRTPRGLGTVKAVLSYCGKAFDSIENGQSKTLYGWQDLQVRRIPQIGWRLSAVCDVPDTILLPRYAPDLQTVSFHAALAAPWEHLTLWSMAWIARVGVVKDWSRYGSSFTAVGKLFQKFGSDRGAMTVRVTGETELGAPVDRKWLLIAEDNHGPEIPCTPSIVIAKKLLHGNLIRNGAHACMGLFTLDEFKTELQEFSVSARFLEARN